MKLPMPDPDDRRMADRIAVDLKVEIYDKGGKKVEGRVRDISMTGLGLALDKVDSFREREVKIRLFLPGEGEINFEASVIWQREDREIKLIGVSGLKIKEEDRKKFADFLMDRLWSMLFTLYVSQE